MPVDHESSPMHNNDMQRTVKNDFRNRDVEDCTWGSDWPPESGSSIYSCTQEVWNITIVKFCWFQRRNKSPADTRFQTIIIFRKLVSLLFHILQYCLLIYLNTGEFCSAYTFILSGPTRDQRERGAGSVVSQHLKAYMVDPSIFIRRPTQADNGPLKVYVVMAPLFIHRDQNSIYIVIKIAYNYDVTNSNNL